MTDDVIKRLEDDNEWLRERLRIVLQFVLAYAEGTGIAFDEAMALAREELENLKETT